MAQSLQHPKLITRNSMLGLRVSSGAIIFAFGFFLSALCFPPAFSGVAGQSFGGAVFAASLPQAAPDKPPEKPERRDFVGTWKASLEGKTFAVVTLKLENDNLSGTIRTGEVDLADDGEVSKVNQEAGKPRVLLEIKLTGQTLAFKDKDGDDLNSLEMKLTGTDRAELKFILPDPLPEGMPMPKPFRLTRDTKGAGGKRGPRSKQEIFSVSGALEGEFVLWDPPQVIHNTGT